MGSPAGGRDRNSTPLLSARTPRSEQTRARDEGIGLGRLGCSRYGVPAAPAMKGIAPAAVRVLRSLPLSLGGRRRND
jgi:hypothetical protein